MINFVPNDPLVVDIMPMRRNKTRPERAIGRAGIAVAGNAPEGIYQPGKPEFVAWQARQAALLAIETWEEATGRPVESWAAESVNPAALLLIPDAGEDVNAYYNRESLSFYHYAVGRKTSFSGASTDVVAHETGHAILDALRPDLWDISFLEVGGFHEAFGDIVAIVTALSDRATREALLERSPDLGAANFVEAISEELADVVRRVAGRSHPASKPRRALNTFRWQLPQTMPGSGGPDDMIAEVHSIARIITGCFYDVLRAVFASSGVLTQSRLWTATKTVAALFHEAANTAPAVPRFFRAIGRAMVLADQSAHNGAHADAIKDAFFAHGLVLGAQAFLAPELSLAGAAPKVHRNIIELQPNTITDLRSRLGAPRGAATRVSLVELGGSVMASVAMRHEVALDTIDRRLRGVVAPVDSVALVGASGGVAALMAAPRAGAPSEEVLDFVGSLVAHQQVEFDERAVMSPESGTSSTTHAIKKRRGKRELRRVRFACGGPRIDD